MERQKKSELARLTEAITDPDDYYRGLRRRGESQPDNILLFVRRSRKRIARPEHERDSFHERWVLLVILAGSGELRLDRRPLPLRSGTVVLLPPLHLHSYANISPRIHWLFVTFEWPGHTATSGDWLGARPLDRAARHRLAAVARHFMERDGTVAAAHLLELLRRLYPENAQAAAPRRHSLLEAVRTAAKEHPGEKLPRLARRLGISESHLRMRFRNEAGLSLGRYLREARLREAALWLREESLSVKAAAERSGYPDIFTFSRAFRRVLGYPPSSIRKPGR